MLASMHGNDMWASKPVLCSAFGSPTQGLVTLDSRLTCGLHVQDLRDALAHSSDELEDEIVRLYETLDPEGEGAVELDVLQAAMVASGAFDADEVGETEGVAEARLGDRRVGMKADGARSLAFISSASCCLSASCWTSMDEWDDKPSWSCAPAPSTVDSP